LRGHHEVPLYPSEIEITIQGHHKKNGVDVCGDDLSFGFQSGGSPNELTLSGQDPNDCSGAVAMVGAQSNPITRNW
jgi:hypothetical protein